MAAQFGQIIRDNRKKAGLTQEELAAKAKISTMSLRRYEKNERQPAIDVAARIAKVIGISVDDLIDQPEPANHSWSVDLDEKLKQIGFSTGFDEDNAALWINYPDGTLEVNETDLKELHDTTNEYMRFKLEELKKKRTQDFRPNQSDPK